MNYSEGEARALVVQAGHRLVECGLVARTWGNISARVSDTHFVITPSGRSYDTLLPQDLVLVQISDCTYEGERKPSSEKGIHAAAYRHRPDVGFVIHTHQDYASCVGVGGKPLTGLAHPLLGDCVPCAAYGMPSTRKLQQGVETAMVRHPDANAILMRQHGALCMAESFEKAFELAQALEDVSKKEFDRAVKIPSGLRKDSPALLNALHSASADLPFSLETDSAVLVPGIGAVCCAKDADDLGAIETIMRKSCMAALYADTCSAAPLSPVDRRIMRLVYTLKYSKKKAEQ